MARFTSSDATLSIYILLLVSSLPGSLAFNKPLNADLTLLGPPLGDIPSTCEGLNISTDKTYLWNSSYDLTRRDYNFKPDSGGPPPPNFRTWIFPTRVFHGGSQLPLQLWLVALQCGTLARGSLSGTSPRDLSPGDLSQAIAFCGDDFTPCSHPALPAADVNFLECPGRMEIKKNTNSFLPAEYDTID